jgi:DNA-binding response OmpR family regulator
MNYQKTAAAAQWRPGSEMGHVFTGGGKVTIRALTLLDVSSHINGPILALLSHDDNLAQIVDSAIEMPWRLERRIYNDRMLDFLELSGVRLVILDDEEVHEGDRGWLLVQIRRHLDDATLLYVAGNHSAENERRARGNGAHYYTAKPLHSHELTGVLKGFMNRINR